MVADDPGYLNAAYARSLGAFGEPRLLPRSRGWILTRDILGTDYRDGVGPYPLFACQDWSAMPEDLGEIGKDLVSLAIVADPFGSYSEGDLRQSFPDGVQRFKEHFIADLSEPPGCQISKHHRYYARKAAKALSVDVLTGDAAAGFVSEWSKLYACLSARHQLTGMKRFSQSAFETQLRLPGVVVLRATEGTDLVGAHIWYVHGEVASSHLAAFNEKGYELMAAYVLYASALEYFRGKVRWLNFGAGAGTAKSSDDGLSRFKRGWATGTRTAFFCTRIFDRDAYDHLVELRPASSPGFFPAYRAGELG